MEHPAGITHDKLVEGEICPGPGSLGCRGGDVVTDRNVRITDERQYHRYMALAGRVERRKDFEV